MHGFHLQQLLGLDEARVDVVTIGMLCASFLPSFSPSLPPPPPPFHSRGIKASPPPFLSPSLPPSLPPGAPMLGDKRFIAATGRVLNQRNLVYVGDGAGGSYDQYRVGDPIVQVCPRLPSLSFPPHPFQQWPSMPALPSFPSWFPPIPHTPCHPLQLLTSSPPSSPPSLPSTPVDPTWAVRLSEQAPPVPDGATLETSSRYLPPSFPPSLPSLSSL